VCVLQRTMDNIPILAVDAFVRLILIGKTEGREPMVLSIPGMGAIKVTDSVVVRTGATPHEGFQVLRALAEEQRTTGIWGFVAMRVTGNFVLVRSCPTCDPRQPLSPDLFHGIADGKLVMVFRFFDQPRGRDIQAVILRVFLLRLLLRGDPLKVAVSELAGHRLKTLSFGVTSVSPSAEPPPVPAVPRHVPFQAYMASAKAKRGPDQYKTLGAFSMSASKDKKRSEASAARVESMAAARTAVAAPSAAVWRERPAHSGEDDELLELFALLSTTADLGNGGGRRRARSTSVSKRLRSRSRRGA